MTPEAAPERSPASAEVGDVVVPHAVTALVGKVPLACVWRNERGGLTFELRAVGQFLKWAPAGSGLPLREEATRLRWARRYAPVPEVLDAGTAEDGSTWLLTARLRGTSAVDDRWKAAPRTAVRAIGEALRAFHEALPVESCPFTWAAEERLGRARERAAAGTIDPVEWHPSHRHLDVEEAVGLVSEPPPVDRLVVCHADACSPNTLIDDDGSWSGHVDLGRMGVGDRWADLAIATWSSTWNYGPGWEGELLAAYGTDADPDRTSYYRLLWDLTD
jgi:aminoglycoside phosphotransferase